MSRVNTVIDTVKRCIPGKRVEDYDDMIVVELDRYRRHDHGGGPDGDDWLPSHEVDKDYQRGFTKYGHYKDKIAKQLANVHIDADIGFELGEKGHFEMYIIIRS